MQKQLGEDTYGVANLISGVERYNHNSVIDNTYSLFLKPLKKLQAKIPKRYCIKTKERKN